MLEKRGVIEGFYGIPWSFEERMSMIEFLSAIGMNQYVYAPKDDPYHNIKWREAYPDDKLAEISKLKSLSEKKGIDFVWAIHPGQNLIDFNFYEEEMARLFAKYDSLHEAGVKSFALCMDDIDRDLAYEQRYEHLRMVKDILKHIESFENKNLLFVHPWYNGAWTDEKGEEYHKIFRDLDNLSIMWTGSHVVVPLSRSSNDSFMKLSGKKANIWFNWPVNDYLRDQIFMEVFEFYDSTDLNCESILSNPMNQAELSKLEIYQIGDFIKDPEGYEPRQSFKKALSYLDKAVCHELFIIADSFFGSGVYDKFEGKKYLEDAQINEAYKKGDFEKLKALLDRKLAAIDSYYKNYTNQSLFREVDCFFTALSYLLKAVRLAIDEDFLGAREFYDKSLACKISVLKESSLDSYEQIGVKTSRVLEGIYEALSQKHPS